MFSMHLRLRSGLAVLAAQACVLACWAPVRGAGTKRSGSGGKGSSKKRPAPAPVPKFSNRAIEQAIAAIEPNTEAAPLIAQAHGIEVSFFARS